MRKCLILLMIFMMIPAMALAEIILSEPVPDNWADREILRVTFLETGRADAILVECGGEAMLIDGAHQAYAKAVKHDLEERGLTRFKFFLNTHPHNDHVEGLTALMDWGVTPVRFLSPVSADYTGDSCHAAAVKSAWKNGVIFRQVHNGDTFTLGNAEIRILCDENGESLNDKSAATRITFGGASILLAADLTGVAQKAHLKLHRELLSADVVKAPHHGENAMVSEFLDAVNPGLVVCTAPKDEAPALVNQMTARKLTALFSGDGAVVLETDGTDWYAWQLSREGKNR